MPQSGGKPNVVIVDDDDFILDLLDEVFSNDYETKTFSNPLLAVQWFQNTESIDCLITDLEMPGLFGDELIEMVQPLHPDLKVFVLTGRPDSPRLKRFHSEGKILIFAKPISLGEFEKAVKTYLLRNSKSRGCPNSEPGGNKVQ